MPKSLSVVLLLSLSTAMLGCGSLDNVTNQVGALRYEWRDSNANIKALREPIAETAQAATTLLETATAGVGDLWKWLAGLGSLGGVFTFGKSARRKIRASKGEDPMPPPPAG